MAPKYLVECNLHIVFPPDIIDDGGEVEITASLIRKAGGKEKFLRQESRLKMVIYRCPEAAGGDAPFESLRAGAVDKDIFVMPRECPTRIHEPYLRRLQLYNNQVLARHKGFNTRFTFVREDGRYSSELERNYRISVDVFQRTRVASNHGLNESKTENGLKAVFPYSFSGTGYKFGQEYGFAKFMASNYGLPEDTVKGLVIDRNFIYGRKVDQSAIGDTQGLKSLYDNVVIPFRRAMIEKAMEYVNFGQGNPNGRWLLRPRFNIHYRRGNFTIEDGDNKSIFTNGTAVTGETAVSFTVGGNEVRTLPVNTVVKFFYRNSGNPNFDGRDSHDYDRTGSHRYRVLSIRLPNSASDNNAPNTGWYIELNYANKQRCNDRAFDENYCNFVRVPQLPEDDPDRLALEEYGRQNGVPYYISQFSGTFKGNRGGKNRLGDFNRLVIPDVANWYSYPDNLKPNAPTSNVQDTTQIDIRGVGLDCSGLIVNCLLDSRLGIGQGNTPFFTGNPTEGFRSYGESAENMGVRRVRRIPHDPAFANAESNTLIQSADLIYSNGHIAICAIGENAHVTTGQITERYFDIIHNYGYDNPNNGENGIFLNNFAWFRQGFFKKTLCGPFAHWGVRFGDADTQAKAGRVFLWY